MRDPVLLGLDLGTSACKLVAFDADCAPLARASRTYPVQNPAPGRFELDADAVWRAVEECLQEIGATSFGSSVCALSLSVQGEAIVPVDRNGRCIAAAPISLDSRAGDEARELESRLGAVNIHAATGQPVSSMPSLPKLMWWRHNDPELHETTWKYLCFGELTLLRLGLDPTIDMTMAARTMGYAISSGTWWREGLDVAGIDVGRLASICPAGEVLGCIPGSVARRLGLPDRVAVVQGGHDQPVGALGGGVLDPGVALYSIGTTEAIVAALQEFRPTLPARGIPCYPHVVPGCYVALAGSQSGGRVLEWYRTAMTMGPQAKPSDDKDGAAALLDEVEDGLPSGPILLPHFAGTGSVLGNEAACAALLGLRFETRRADILRALLEGITYEQAIGIDALDAAGARLGAVRAIGGGTRSPRWLQIKADILGRPLEHALVEDAACLGAAMLAGHAIGLLPSLHEVADRIRIGACYRPRPEHHAIHQSRRRLYRDLYEALRPHSVRLRAA